MTVVSSKEFVTNQKKYFDLAVNEEVFIKRGKNKFHLLRINRNHTPQNESEDKEPVYYEPDEDFYNSISMDELLEGVLEDIHNFYANKNESNSNIKG